MVRDFSLDDFLLVMFLLDSFFEWWRDVVRVPWPVSWIGGCVAGRSLGPPIAIISLQILVDYFKVWLSFE